MRIIIYNNLKMDSHKNFTNNNDITYDDSQIIEDMKSINITNKSESKKQLNESTNLHKISDSIYLNFNF